MYKIAPLIASFLIVLSLAGPTATALETNDVTVTLVVLTQHTEDEDPGELWPLPGHASCDVVVPEGSDGGEVLDQAVLDYCILEWNSTTFDGARFVTSVDGLRATGVTCILFSLGVCDFWELRIDGSPATSGIDDYEAADGDAVTWRYVNFLNDP